MSKNKDNSRINEETIKNLAEDTVITVLNIEPASTEYNPNDIFDEASIEKNDTSNYQLLINPILL